MSRSWKLGVEDGARYYFRDTMVTFTAFYAEYLWQCLVSQEGKLVTPCCATLTESRTKHGRTSDSVIDKQQSNNASRVQSFFCLPRFQHQRACSQVNYWNPPAHTAPGTSIRNFDKTPETCFLGKIPKFRGVLRMCKILRWLVGLVGREIPKGRKSQ